MPILYGLLIEILALESKNLGEHMHACKHTREGERKR